MGGKILAKNYLKDDFFLLLRKLSKALWYICVILVFWEAEAGRLSLMPAWVSYVMRTFLEEKENRSSLCLSLSLCSRYMFYKWESVLTSLLLAEKLFYPCSQGAHLLTTVYMQGLCSDLTIWPWRPGCLLSQPGVIWDHGLGMSLARSLVYGP